MARTITKVYIHCSFSEWGSADVIKQWHLDKGWQDIGYHYVVHNQFTSFESFKRYVAAIKSGNLQDRLFCSRTDGEIVAGRPLSLVGSHVKSDNTYSIGICYIGITPTISQYSAMLLLCRSLISDHKLLNAHSVFGHYEYWTERGEKPQKTCPNFDMDTFRRSL